MKTSSALVVGRVYSRIELAGTFSITDATLQTGIFRPKGHDSIWLFITEEKTPDRTQYHDFLDGDDLHCDGQSSGRKDSVIINHESNGLELLLFHRKAKREFDNYGFRYEGVFRYVSHEGSKPAHFLLRRVASVTDTPIEPSTEAVSTTPWGTEVNTGSASIDWVLLDATRPLSAREIMDEVRRRGLTERKDANPHLTTLKRNKFITNEDGKWFRVIGQSGAISTNPAPQTPKSATSTPTEDASFAEGKERLRLHRSLERNKTLVRRKKAQVLAAEHKLACEACGFDFANVYGPLGDGFAECHHTRPFAEVRVVRQTKLSELAVVCANCHRMLHRSPFHTVTELRNVLLGRR